MLLRALVLGGLLAAGLPLDSSPPTPAGAVVINEFQYDDSGVDDREFVELYNRHSVAVDISRWTLESEDAAGPNPSYRVRDNVVLPPGGFYVLGSSNLSTVDQAVGAIDLWENGPDSLTLRDARGVVIDSLVYEANKGLWSAARAEGEGVWGNFTSSDGLETSWSRMRDGHDTDNNRDFRIMPVTPGRSNNAPPGGCCKTFDASAIESPVEAFGGTFAAGRVIDPTKTTASNPSVIPASPQGGHAAAFWNPSGGNANMLLRDAVADLVLETYVYIDAKPRPAGQQEVWTIGVQGTTGTHYNIPDLAATNRLTLNGNTGVTWNYLVDSSGATVFLWDNNDGGWGAGAKTPPRLLGKIPVRVTVNDGWQRLRLEVSGNRVTGYYGGTYGGTDGTKLTGTISAPSIGGVYLAYRVQPSTSTGVRPLTLDRLEVLPALRAAVNWVGNPVGTTSRVPRLATNAAPRLGTRVRVTATGLVEKIGNPSALILGSALLPVPIALDALLGAPPGSRLLLRPDSLVAVPNDGSGTFSFDLAIPLDPCFAGASLHYQVFDFDERLMVPFKFGHSRVLSIVPGS